jgi:UTP:GlnB (protein PII) uridylyltransferase
MPTLVELGVVERHEAPPSALFRRVPDNIASRSITSLTLAHPTVLAEMGSTAARIGAPPVSVVVFGSFARGEADSRSDIDLLVVRPRRVDEEEPAWRHDLDDWAGQVGRLTGNQTEMLEVGEAELARLLRGRKPLWADIQRDGILVFGSPLASLKEPRGA